MIPATCFLMTGIPCKCNYVPMEPNSSRTSIAHVKTSSRNVFGVSLIGSGHSVRAVTRKPSAVMSASSSIPRERCSTPGAGTSASGDLAPTHADCLYYRR
jgi:hypothetical protein